ncbi:MAG TPA: ATP-dependent helicase, partial [Ktedonobacteraceae bacterium]|nr:ATP-dependent helicase [Ktedonobacteraceae bacterium]
MEIASALLKYPYVMNEQQCAIISHKQGPLLVVAGPGSGKTRSLTLLAINLLLCGDAEPSQIVLCTYTEKAAYELQDRLTSIARNVGYQGDLFQLRIGTIHSICQRIIDEHLHHTSLSHGYETLDQFTQQLLIFNQLEKICPKHTWSFLHDRWGTRWEVAKKLKFYFDIITEELLFEKLKENISQLRKHQTFVDTLLHHLTYAYDHYRQVLVDTNSTDFAHIQKWAHKLLTGPDTASHITKDIRYVLVDEYQDTNYIQEQILTLLASGTRPANFVAIGDEDQALYRFRGATVRNILTFAQTFPACKQIYLTTNYRSQIGIIDVCNHWIQRFDWSNSNGVPLRTEKSLRSDASSSPSPSVICLEAIDVYDEAGQIADFVATLKERGKIEDYSDVALLLYSVRPEKSDPYIQALEKRGISAYCPRARAFFQQREIKLLLGCFARVFLYPAEQRSPEITNEDFLNYIADCQRELMLCCRRYPSLERVLGRIAHEIEMILERDEAFNVEHLSRYFYQLLFEEPFFSFQKQEQKKANLVSFSNLIETFRQHYRQNASPGDRLNEIGTSFFERFFLFLQQEGLNEDQDQQQIFLQGHVQIMTIHQAKGLEFPVVVVGRL